MLHSAFGQKIMNKQIKSKKKETSLKETRPNLSVEQQRRRRAPRRRLVIDMWARTTRRGPFLRQRSTSTWARLFVRTAQGGRAGA
jgi:hypothetical protein